MDADLIVQSALGPIKGNRRVSYLGEVFFSFRGVPYAKPPVGELRFKDPQPLTDDWETPLDATQLCVSAPFVDETEPEVFITSEDCLVLNIYTKKIQPESPIPVMVWIHGGSFRVGSSSEHMYGPDFLLQKEVIIVTVNYRLGALGFLSIDDPIFQIPGNAGLKDQTLALRWIKSNINAFGGDPNNVTIFGNSAGAISVHLHMLSDFSRDLFHKAIVQSGFATAEYANFPKSDWTRRLAKAIGWSGDGGDAALYAFLREADVDDIVKHQDAILTSEEAKSGIFGFGPAVEAYVGQQSFFTQCPRSMMANPWSRSIPLIIGANSDEMIMLNRTFKKQPTVFQSLEGFELLVPPNFGLQKGGIKSKQLAKRIMREYYGNDEPQIDNYRTTMDIWSDRFFWHPLEMSIRARLENPETTGLTFLYRFNVDSKIFNWKKLQFAGEYLAGASHADEVHYLFKCSYLKENLDKDSLEMRTMKRMIALWSQFAITGDPNCPENAPLYWSTIDDLTAPLHCLNIADEFSTKVLPENTRIEFWKRLNQEFRDCNCSRLFVHECSKP